MYKPVTLK